MRKMSLILHACAAIVSITAAFAFSQSPTERRLLYYRNGDHYYPAGTEGVDYICLSDPDLICTYYYNASTGQYLPNKAGRIIWIDK